MEVKRRKRNVASGSLRPKIIYAHLIAFLQSEAIIFKGSLRDMNIRGIVVGAALTFTASMFAANTPANTSANTGVDYYSAGSLTGAEKKLAAKTKASSNSPTAEPLAKYSHDYTLLVYRNASGSAEMHEHESDLYLVLDGEATLKSGGKMVGQHTKSEGEYLGTGISGGHAQKLGKGDVVHISPNIPHQLLIEPGHTFSYFVLKVKE
jgi:mannose-6-phosphate isomerase-like protein (cupin superfamily)